MKILHVMAGAPEGGAETFFLEGALALADGDISQHVLTRPNNDFRLSEFGGKGGRRHPGPVPPPHPLAHGQAVEKGQARLWPDIIQLIFASFHRATSRSAP